MASTTNQALSDVLDLVFEFNPLIGTNRENAAHRVPPFELSDEGLKAYIHIKNCVGALIGIIGPEKLDKVVCDCETFTVCADAFRVWVGEQESDDAVVAELHLQLTAALRAFRDAPRGSIPTKTITDLILMPFNREAGSFTARNRSFAARGLPDEELDCNERVDFLFAKDVVGQMMGAFDESSLEAFEASVEDVTAYLDRVRVFIAWAETTSHLGAVSDEVFGTLLRLLKSVV